MPPYGGERMGGPEAIVVVEAIVSDEAIVSLASGTTVLRSRLQIV